MSQDKDQVIVVNIKQGEQYDHYIGRSRKGAPRNPLQNDYQIGAHGDRIEVIRKFAYDFPIKWRTEPTFREAVLQLKGRIGCFCAPQYCHGDIYKVFLEALPEGEEAGFTAIERYIENILSRKHSSQQQSMDI